MLPRIPSFTSNVTDYIPIVYFVCTIFLIIFSFLRLIFNTENPILNVYYTIIVIFSWLLIFAILFLAYKIFNAIHEKWKIEKLKRARNGLLIGLAGSFSSGMFPRIVAFCAGDGYRVKTLLSIYIGLGSIILFYYFFTIQARSISKLKFKYNDKIAWILLFLNLIVFLITLRIGASFSDLSRRGAIFTSEIGFFAICTLNMIEFWTVVRGGLKEEWSVLDQERAERDVIEAHRRWEWRQRNREGAVEDVEILGRLEEMRELEMDGGERLIAQDVPEMVVVQKPDSSKTSETRLECKICMQEYCNLHIPRILKECGHTVCEQCADKLMDNSNTCSALSVKG